MRTWFYWPEGSLESYCLSGLRLIEERVPGRWPVLLEETRGIGRDLRWWASDI